MSFTKKTWTDRISEYPTRRTLTKEDGTTETVTVTREEGTISQEGDAYSAANMNDLEQRVADGFSTLSQDSVKIATKNTTSDSIAFGIDSNGNYGYIKEGADTVTPFKSQKDIDNAYNSGVAAADARVNTSSASYSNGYSAGNSAGYSNGGQTITISGTIAAMHVDRDYVGTRNSIITITIQKDSYVSASCSSVELKSGEVGMYVGGTKRYSAGWSNTGSSSYSGNISAGQSVKFYANAGGADSQHANMNISLTIRR